MLSLSRLLFVLFMVLSCERPAVKSDDELSVDDNRDEDSVVKKALLVFTQGNELDYGAVGVGGSDSNLIIVKNTGNMPAQIVDYEPLGSEFKYLGGSFPGTDGTCSNEVQPDEICLLDVEFEPSNSGDFDTDIWIEYDNNNGGNILFSLALKGEGVGQGESDPNFGDNGVKTIDYGNDEEGMDVIESDDEELKIIGHSDDGNSGDNNVNTILLDRDGEVDNTYGNAGKVTTDTLSNVDDTITAVADDGNGNPLIVLNFNTNINSCLLDEDGALDSTYGILGTGVSVLGSILNLGEDIVKDVLVQSDGTKIIVGESFPLIGKSSMFIIKLSTVGIIDISLPIFGNALTPGVRNISFGVGSDDQARTIEISPSNKLIVGGIIDDGTQVDSALVSLDLDGDIDTSFGGGDGKLSLDICGENDDDQINAIKVQSDNKIIAVGYCEGILGKDAFIARFHPNGAIDTNFGGSGTGILRFDISNSDDEFVDLSIGSDGKILAAGRSFNGVNFEILMIRVDINGDLDTSFGVNGIAQKDIGFDVKVRKIKRLVSGKILLVGKALKATSDFLIARFIY